jgi:hypothetical protein
MSYEQEVVASLRSKADTSGFAAFKAAQDGLAGSAHHATEANNVFVESERRVRTNLVDTVSGIANAKDSTEALSEAVAHLSEIFELGAVGMVAAGVGAAIVEQFSKAEQQVKATAQSIEEATAKASEMQERLSGHQRSEQDKDKDQIRKMGKDLAASRENQGSTFTRENLLLGFNKLSGGMLFQDDVEQIQKNQENQGELGAKIEQLTLANGRAETYAKPVRDKELTRVNEDFTRQGIKQEEEDQRAGEAGLRAQKAATAEAARLSEEQKRKEGAAASEKERQAQRTEREEAKQESKEGKDLVKPGNVHLQTIAGHQREIGGGGRAASVITIDPAVVEQRRTNTLLTEISQTLKGARSAPPPVARAA